MQKRINNDEEFTLQEIQNLTNIAWQNAWEGGDAVFDARRLLMIEVDDQEHNLRLAQKQGGEKDFINYLNVFPNPSSGVVKFYSASISNSLLVIVDAIGKIIQTNDLSSGGISIDGLASGIYYAKLLSGGELIAIRQFTIIK